MEERMVARLEQMMGVRDFMSFEFAAIAYAEVLASREDKED